CSIRIHTMSKQVGSVFPLRRNLVVISLRVCSSEWRTGDRRWWRRAQGGAARIGGVSFLHPLPRGTCFFFLHRACSAAHPQQLVPSASAFRRDSVTSDFVLIDETNSGTAPSSASSTAAPTPVATSPLPTSARVLTEPSSPPRLARRGSISKGVSEGVLTTGG